MSKIIIIDTKIFKEIPSFLYAPYSELPHAFNLIYNKHILCFNKVSGGCEIVFVIYFQSLHDKINFEEIRIVNKYQLFYI